MNLKNIFDGRNGSFRILLGLLLILGGVMGCKSRSRTSPVAYPNGISPYGYGSQTSQQNTFLQREQLQWQGKLFEIQAKGQVNNQEAVNQMMLVAVVLSILKGGASGLEDIISRFNKSDDPSAAGIPAGAAAKMAESLTPQQLAALRDMVLKDCEACKSGTCAGNIKELCDKALSLQIPD